MGQTARNRRVFQAVSSAGTIAFLNCEKRLRKGARRAALQEEAPSVTASRAANALAVESRLRVARRLSPSNGFFGLDRFSKTPHRGIFAR